MPLSPSFPDWLLKRDPTLAGALTNPLFLAFEERRQRRWGGKWAAFFASPSRMIAAGVPIICIVVGVGVLQFSIGLLWITILFGTVLGHYAGRGFLLRRSEANLTPSYLRDGIWPTPVLPVLREMWTTPNGPEVYMEALILESRMGIHVAAGIVSLLWALFASGIWGMYRMPFGRLALTFADVLLAAAILVCLIRMLPPLYWVMNNDQLSHMDRKFMGFGGGSSVDPRPAESLSVFLKAFIWFAGTCLAVGWASVLAWAVWTSIVEPLLSDIGRPLLEFDLGRILHLAIANNHVQLSITTILIIPTYLMGPLGRRFRSSYEREYARTIAKATVSIPAYFDSVLER